MKVLLTLLPLAPFMACLIMTRVSNISANILDSRLFLTAGLTKIMPFGVTITSASTPLYTTEGDLPVR